MAKKERKENMCTCTFHSKDEVWVLLDGWSVTCFQATFHHPAMLHSVHTVHGNLSNTASSAKTVHYMIRSNAIVNLEDSHAVIKHCC